MGHSSKGIRYNWCLEHCAALGDLYIFGTSADGKFSDVCNEDTNSEMFEQIDTASAEALVEERNRHLKKIREIVNNATFKHERK